MPHHVAPIDTRKLRIDPAFPAQMHLSLPLALWDRVVRDTDKTGQKALHAKPRRPPPELPEVPPLPPREYREGRKRVEFSITPEVFSTPPSSPVKAPPQEEGPAAPRADDARRPSVASILQASAPSTATGSGDGPSTAPRSLSSGSSVTTECEHPPTPPSPTSPPLTPAVGTPTGKSRSGGVLSSVLCCFGWRSATPSFSAAPCVSHREALVEFRLRLIRLCDRWGRASKHSLVFSVATTAQPHLGAVARQVSAQEDLLGAPWVITSLALHVATVAVTLHSAALSSVSLNDIALSSSARSSRNGGSLTHSQLR